MPTERRLERIREVQSRRQKDVILVLEDVWDPHNAEAIFRSCDAFGIQDVYLIFDQQEPFDPHDIGHRSSASAHKWLSFQSFGSSLDCLAKLKEEGFTTVATALAEDADSLYESTVFDPKVSEKLAIFIGNESRGLSQTVLDAVDTKVMIPMRGMVQSLNVSVTSGIVLFELTRQRSIAT